MNTRLLALSTAQCCYWFATLVGISLSAIVGLAMAPSPALATLPFALSSLGGLLCTYPLSLYMQRRSRRAGLRLGTAAGAVAAALCCLALQLQSFALFCAASLLMGGYQASAVFYRLAAMDEAPSDAQAKAISWVLCGSLLAAIAGPVLAKSAAALPLGAIHTGPYLLVLIFALLGYAVLGVLGSRTVQAAPADALAETPTSRAAYFALPSYRLGLCNTASAQFLMMLMMVIAPLAMHAEGYAAGVSLSVIGWHILGMFLPSFFSGKLIDKLGTGPVIVAGFCAYMLSAITAVIGTDLLHFYLCLFLLGLAWNFVYIAGTTQYNSALSTSLKARGQGFAELSIALAAAVAVFSGGVMITFSSWQQINRVALVFSALCLAINVFCVFRKRRLGPKPEGTQA